MLMTVGVGYPRPAGMIDIRMPEISGFLKVIHHTIPLGSGDGAIQADEGGTVILERDFDKVHIGSLA